MPPRIALLLTLVFVAWLFITDQKRRGSFSRALWVPFCWILILGSRPVSTWFSGSSEGLDEASNTNLNRFIFIGLIIAGAVVLMRRKLNFSQILARCRPLQIYFIYIGASALWSDFTMTVINQWIKDIGNVIMVLVILSEDDPGEAVNATLTRCAYILVPFSFLVTKYFPEIGRSYNRWTYEPIVLGVTQDKNYLGAMLLVTGTVLIWGVLDRKNEQTRLGKVDMLNYVIVLLMAFWLLVMANSATSMFCILISSAILLALKWESVRERVVRFQLPVVAIVFAFLVLAQVMFDVGGAITGLFGRNMTFTGRTEIWERCLKVPVNPLIGEGYCSFWLSDKSEPVSDGFYYRLMEAHDGYLEEYLNLGWIGVGLLAVILYWGINRVKQALVSGESFAAFRFAFIFVVLFYNVTESAFNGINLVWFTMLLIVIEVPRHDLDLPMEAAADQNDVSMDESEVVEREEVNIQSARKSHLIQAVGVQLRDCANRIQGSFWDGTCRLRRQIVRAGILSSLFDRSAACHVLLCEDV